MCLTGATGDRIGVLSRVAVVGAGIAGLSAALDLIDAGLNVTVFDSAPTMGGRIVSSPFAGLSNVDEGADAFLVRVPDAVALAGELGLRDELVSPQAVGAAVWHDGLHAIPDGLVLGLPGRPMPLLRTRLLSTRGKLRAGLDLIAPRTSTAPDSIGAFVRGRFGDEVHERLVDALVGSIYATDTDNFSLAEVPQLAALAEGDRSILLAARRHLRKHGSSGTAVASGPTPIFATPRRGLASLTDAAADRIRERGGELRTGSRISRLHSADHGVTLMSDTSDDDHFDGVVVACPAKQAAILFGAEYAEVSTLLQRAETADVIMVTLHLADSAWPQRLREMSGYLVPKPDQHLVTAVSFGSQKWSHWQPPTGGHILRVSLGRDGQHVLDLDDDAVITGVLTDLERHLGFPPVPLEVRITRWPGAFAQYRPHHRAWVTEVERALPAGIVVAGSSYHGIGIPACIRSGRSSAELMARYASDLAD